MHSAPACLPYDACVLLNLRRAGRSVIQGHGIPGTSRLPVLAGALDCAAMRIMTTGALHTMRVHHALHKIVPLHSILVTRTVRVVRERRITEFVLLQLPVFLEIIAHMKTNRPVEIFTLNGILERLSLRMALDASIVCARGIKPCRIYDVGLRRSCNVFAAGSVTTFAPNVPLSYGFQI